MKKQSWDVKGSVYIQLALLALHDDLFVKPKALSPKLVYIEDHVRYDLVLPVSQLAASHHPIPGTHINRRMGL